jgi:asparagine synthase (glutamine-hydrolysing)
MNDAAERRAWGRLAWRRVGEGLLLNRLAARAFGRAFVNRPKQGFGIPLEQWLRGPLRARMIETRSDRTLIEPFDAAVVAQTVTQFLCEHRPDYKHRLWALRMCGTWRETVCRSEPVNSRSNRLNTHAVVAANCRQLRQK